MTKNKTLKLALKALETIAKRTGARWALEQGYAGHLEAITAIKEALAQPEQEPLGYIASMAANDLRASIYRDVTVYGEDLEDTVAIYTTPPQRQPLTDKQILADETLRYYFGQNGGAGPVSKQGRKVVNAIEALHDIKEKNT
jgi:hypothetical protein